MNKEKANYKDKAYEVIRNKILMCEIMPGELIDQNALAEEIGISRMPVREALNRLEQEKLVRVIPRKSVEVARVSLKEVNDIFSVRTIVEPAIAKLVTPLVDVEVMQKFSSVFSKDEGEDVFEFCKNDLLLHKYIVELANNNYLESLMDNILAHNQRMVILNARIPNRLGTSNAEHMEIIRLMIEGDADGAEDAVRKHIFAARDIHFESMMYNGLFKND